ncbi:hypothetical protein [Gemmatimonas aurantiaca]|uniref:hypothetical protein n=1 Tax=Gemmatimonas aurantiaca TaxID=173480 RepID=UPI0012EAEAB5|nr:hypothetical protein [Gemmatimonas aurantiaca]
MTSPSVSSGTIAGSVLPIRRAEELIQTLPGVLSVRIVPSETGAVDEIHVLTTDQVVPKHTVRNIESALMAQLGLRVNHRKVSVATTLDAPRIADLPGAPAGVSGVTAVPGVTHAAPQGIPSFADQSVAAPASVAGASAPVVEPAKGPTRGVAGGMQGVAAESVLSRLGSSPQVVSRPDMAAGRRLLIFEDIEVRRSHVRGVTCLVSLSRDGQSFVGEADGQESERSRVDLAARATVQAILAARGAPAGDRGLSLEGAEVLEAFDREFVFVSISARVGRGSIVLTGTCEVRDSAETSAVLAVLDATNRWLHLDR